MSRDYGVEYKTARDRLYDLLADLYWHSAKELSRVGGVRYGARILELKRLGYQIESREVEGQEGKDYRLISRHKGSPQQKRVKVLLTEDDAHDLAYNDTLTDRARDAIQNALGSFRTNKDKL